MLSQSRAGILDVFLTKIIACNRDDHVQRGKRLRFVILLLTRRNIAERGVRTEETLL